MQIVPLIANKKCAVKIYEEFLSSPIEFDWYHGRVGAPIPQGRVANWARASLFCCESIIVETWKIKIYLVVPSIHNHFCCELISAHASSVARFSALKIDALASDDSQGGYGRFADHLVSIF